MAYNPFSIQTLSALACAATVGLLGGCSQLAETELGVEAVQFRDVRIPGAMTIVSSKAESHSQAVGQAYRFGDFEYIGRVPVADAIAYVTSAMPTSGWSLVTNEAAAGAPGSHKLEFTRGIYDAAYFIEPAGRVTKMRVELRTSPARPAQTN